MTADEIEKLGVKHGFAATRLHTAKTSARIRTAATAAPSRIDDPMYASTWTTRSHQHVQDAPQASLDGQARRLRQRYIMSKILGRSQQQIAELYGHGVLGKWKDQQAAGRPPTGRHPAQS